MMEIFLAPSNGFHWSTYHKVVLHQVIHTNIFEISEKIFYQAYQTKMRSAENLEYFPMQ